MTSDERSALAFASVSSALARTMQCAVQRHGLSVGANPTRQLSLQPVAIGGCRRPRGPDLWGVLPPILP